MKMSKLATMFVAAAILTVAGFAQAQTVDYTVYGWAPTQYPAPTTPPANAPWGVNGYPGDTLGTVAYTGTLNLTPGTYKLEIDTLTWKIDYTYGGTATDPTAWSDVVSNVTATRGISFAGGPAGTISQTGILDCAWDNDYLTLNDGPTSSFVVGGYQVDVTPLGLSDSGSSFDGSNPWTQPDQSMEATFTVTATPEPATMCFLALGGLALLRNRRK
jgi:hypothetical protein